MNFDWTQRLTLGSAIILLSIFAAHTAGKHPDPQPQGPSPQAPPKPQVQQESKGSNSPNIVGDNNTVNINPAPSPKRLKKGDKVDISEGSVFKGFREGESDSVFVNFGGMTVKDSKAHMMNGAAMTSREFNAPLLVTMDKSGKLLFSCELVGINGYLLFHIKVKDNVFIAEGPDIDKNASEAALEIVDDNGHPLFQVIQKDKNTLQINGVFYGGEISPGTPKRTYVWSNFTETSLQRPKEFDLKPIFKYPSWKYRGQYAD